MSVTFLRNLKQDNVFGMTLGEKIKAARKAKGWFQHDLAKKVGVEPPTVSRWEKDHIQPDAQNMKAIAEALDKPAEWFYGELALAPDILRAWEMRLRYLEEKSGTKSDPSSFNISIHDQKFWVAWQSAKEKWRRDIALFFLTGDPDEMTEAVPEELRKRLLEGLRFHKMMPVGKNRAPKK